MHTVYLCPHSRTVVCCRCQARAAIIPPDESLTDDVLEVRLSKFAEAHRRCGVPPARTRIEIRAAIHDAVDDLRRSAGRSVMRGDAPGTYAAHVALDGVPWAEVEAIIARDGKLGGNWVACEASGVPYLRSIRVRPAEFRIFFDGLK